MPVPTLNPIERDTPAAAEPVNNNYTTIADYIDDFCIKSDGSTGMNAQLHLVGNPVNDNDAATKAYADNVLPIGVILPWPAPGAPGGGWLLCDGATKAIATYPELSSTLGARYNVGTVATGNFMLPNLKGRVIVGCDGASTSFGHVGNTGGTWTVPVPIHQHQMSHTHEHPHTHTMPHTHSIAHDHGAFNTSAPLGGHRHQLDLGLNSTPGAVLRAMAGSTAGTHEAIDGGYDTDSPHLHQVNVPPLTGVNSGASSATNTGAVSEATTSQPSVSLTSHQGINGAEHVPPYLTLNYIIKALN